MTPAAYNQDVFFFVGTDNGHQADVTVSVDDPSIAFVGFISPNVVKVVPKVQTGGTVNVSITGKSQNGAVLPAHTEQVVFAAKPVPQALQLTVNPNADPLFTESAANSGVTDNGLGQVTFTVNAGQ